LGDLLTWTSKAKLDDIQQLLSGESEELQKLLQVPDKLKKLTAQMEIAFLNDMLNNSEDDPQ
jgi:hypothetical protein